MPTEYFTLEVDGSRHTLMRRVSDERGESLEYADPKTGLWIDDPTLIDLFVGDDPYSEPDPDLTEISEAEARELAGRYGARL